VKRCLCSTLRSFPETVAPYGRNGAIGQTETKSFLNDEAATKHAESKIAEKLKKGCVEVK